MQKMLRASLCGLCTAVAVILIVMTAFSSGALAQQAQPPRPSWHGTFEWTHVCDGPPGYGIKTRGIGKLELDYSESGSYDAYGTFIPERTLNGMLTGIVPEHAPSAPSCSITLVAPGTFYAQLKGSHTPGQNTFSVYVFRVQTTPARASVTCHSASHMSDLPYYTAFETPMFEDAFRDLRRQPDGSLKSKGERTTSVGVTTCTTNYALTLQVCGSNMPEHGTIYAAPGHNPRLYSAPSADSTLLRVLVSGVRVRYTQTKQVNGQTWFFY